MKGWHISRYGFVAAAALMAGAGIAAFYNADEPTQVNVWQEQQERVEWMQRRYANRPVPVARDEDGQLSYRVMNLSDNARRRDEGSVTILFR